MGTEQSIDSPLPADASGEGSGMCSRGKVQSKQRPVRRRLTTLSWRKSSSTPLLAVVRHAERADDLGAAFNGSPWGLTEDAKQWPLDPPLSDAGMRMAKDIASELKDVADELVSNFEVVVASPYFRCVQTAIEICRRFGPKCRLLIDYSLGETFSPELFGDREPQLVLRPSSQAVELCRRNSISGRRLRKPLGKKPEWPENVRSGRLRVIASLDNYMRRSLAAKKNFVLVTHAEGVAAAFESMQMHRKVASVDYGAFFCACHRIEDEKQHHSTDKQRVCMTQVHGLNFYAASPDLFASDDFVVRPTKHLSGMKSCAIVGQSTTPKSTTTSSTTNFFCLSDVDALSSPTSSPTLKGMSFCHCESPVLRGGANGLPVLLGRGMSDSPGKTDQKPKEVCLRLENSALHRKRRKSITSQSSVDSPYASEECSFFTSEGTACFASEDAAYAVSIERTCSI